MMFCSIYLVPEVMEEITVEDMVLITPVPIHLTEALDTDTEDIMVWDMPPVLLLGDSREV
ncbi:hypothetical protein EHN65_25050 [Salmonella enterica]|nr:hypothetical protein [Salmonella enterica]EBI5828202.1 hypothetical protein [Salmonella enterica]